MKLPPSAIIPRDQLPDGADYQLANSFPNFLTAVWWQLGFDSPTRNQLAAAHFLQYGPAKKQLICFRGMGKSYITVPFSVWCMYRDPHTQTLITSATGGLSGDNARFAWMMINNFPWLTHMIPTSDQAQSYKDFDVRGARPAKGTSLAARGIFGQITGLRADVAIQDDTETPNTSDTAGARETLRKRVSEIGGAILKPGGQSIFLGTPQCEETIYRDNELSGYSTIIIPVLYPTPEEVARYGRHRLAPHILKDLEENPELAGTSTEPTRFGPKDIAERRQEFGRREFNRQFKMFMDLSDMGGQTLALKDLDFIDLQPWNKEAQTGGLPTKLIPHASTDKPIDTGALDIFIDALSTDSHIYAPQESSEYGPPEEVVLHIDPSGEGKDETAWCVTACRTGRIYLLDLQADIRGYRQEVLQRIADTAKKWGVNSIYVEDNMGLGMMASLLSPVLKRINHSCIIETVRVGKAFKERRIMSVLEPLVSSHRLVMNLDIMREDYKAASNYGIEDTKKRFYRFAYQFTRIREIRGCLPHDDRVDVLASGCQYWAERLIQAEEEAEEEADRARLNAEIDRINRYRKAQGLDIIAVTVTDDLSELLQEESGKRLSSNQGTKRLNSSH